MLNSTGAGGAEQPPLRVKKIRSFSHVAGIGQYNGKRIAHRGPYDLDVGVDPFVERVRTASTGTGSIDGERGNAQAHRYVGVGGTGANFNLVAGSFENAGRDPEQITFLIGVAGWTITDQ